MCLFAARRPLALFFLIASLLGSPVETWGKKRPKRAGAARLMREADRQCIGDQPEAALLTYQRALDVKPLPRIHLAYGDCLRQLGKCDQAIEQYRLFLRKAKGRKAREQAEALIKLCQDQLREQSATVGLTVVPARLAPARRAARAKQARAKQTRANDALEQLTRVAAAPAPVPPPPPGSRRTLPSHYFWAGVVVTAAMAVVGTASGALALQRSSQYKDPTTSEVQMPMLKDSGEALKLTSTISFAVAGATAAATTVIFFFTRFSATETAGASPVAGGAVVTMGGRF
jgi:tetratricopeptide (TPR) repeat protein